MDHLLTKNVYDVSGRVALVTGGGTGMYVLSLLLLFSVLNCLQWFDDRTGPGDERR